MRSSTNHQYRGRNHAAPGAKEDFPQGVETRMIAARVIARVITRGRSLSTVLSPALTRVPEQDQGLLQELCYGTLRWYLQLRYLVGRLLQKPLRCRDREIETLLCLGLYQLLHMRVPEYAAVTTTVAAVRGLTKQSWAVSLVNGVLRNFLRRRAELMAAVHQDETLDSAHPQWLLECMRSDWPHQWPAIVRANNAHPPQNLRINLARISRIDYLDCLTKAGISALPQRHTSAGITLEKAWNVERLPGFREGLVSVQDAAAQLAAELLDLRPGLRLLDACAAPGGKFCHILETEPALASAIALDIDGNRLAQVKENLNRLGLQARLMQGDARQPETWWDGIPYDRILLDVPCSATGVIRRHPDIKVLRRQNDIPQLAQRQHDMLTQLWPLLAPKGMLLYSTCSILKRENEFNIGRFLELQSDAREQPIAAQWGQAASHGKQILPGETSMDGFFYACLIKNPNE